MMKERLYSMLYKGGLTLFFVLCTMSELLAQPPVGGPPGSGGGSTGTTPPCWEPPCIPIDGGLGFLIAAGAFLGIRKLYNGKNA